MLQQQGEKSSSLGEAPILGLHIYRYIYHTVAQFYYYYIYIEGEIWTYLSPSYRSTTYIIITCRVLFKRETVKSTRDEEDAGFKVLGRLLAYNKVVTWKNERSGVASKKGSVMKRGGRRNVHAYFVTELWGVRSGQKRIRKRCSVQFQLVICELRTRGRENCGDGEDKRMGNGVSTLNILLLRWEELLLLRYLMVCFNEALV